MIDLNIELSKCDDWASSTLPERERRYMFEGLPHLMERLLISKARHIRALNAFGIKKMNRNMLALQQNIKTITQNSNDAEFDRGFPDSKEFPEFDNKLFSELNRIVQHGYTHVHWPLRVW